MQDGAVYLTDGAAATGSASNSANTASTGLPSSFSRVRSASVLSMGGASACRLVRAF